MKIAVLGGNGYLGGRVASGLAVAYDTTIITRRPYFLNDCKNIVAVFNDRLYESLIDFDVIVNCVGANRAETALDPKNAIAIKRNLSYCLAKLSKIKKMFVFHVSSKHVYSPIVTENKNQNLQSKGLYAYGHSESEKYLSENFFSANGSNYQIMRLSNCFGYASTASKEFFNLFLNQLIDGMIKGRPLVIENPKITSSFTPMNIVVDYIKTALIDPFSLHEKIIDIGVPYAFSLGDATLLIESIFCGDEKGFRSYLCKSDYGSKFILSNPNYADESWFIDEVKNMRALYSDVLQ